MPEVSQTKNVLAADLWSPAAVSWLQSSRNPRLLHCFAEVCNLVNERGEPLSLATPEVGPGPFALVVPGLRPYLAQLAPQTAVSIHEDTLQLGALLVTTATAQLWQPRPMWRLWQDYSDLWRGRLPMLQARVDAEMAELAAEMVVFEARFREASQQAVAGLLEEDETRWQTAVAQLAGLGPGLTPAGDDFLMGLLYGLWASEPREKAFATGQAVLSVAKPRTTTWSAAWLMAAARGEAVLGWHTLAAALALNDADWETAVTAVLETGHSSGLFALAGFTAVLTEVDNKQE